jgi:hypothetical protein
VPTARGVTSVPQIDHPVGRLRTVSNVAVMERVPALGVSVPPVGLVGSVSARLTSVQRILLAESVAVTEYVFQVYSVHHVTVVICGTGNGASAVTTTVHEEITGKYAADLVNVNVGGVSAQQILSRLIPPAIPVGAPTSMVPFQQQ